MRKLNKADLWLIDEVKNKLTQLCDIEPQDAEQYVQDSTFMDLLYSDPVDVHHDEPIAWAKDIAEQHDIALTV